MFACTAYLMVRSLGCARVPIGGTAAGYTVTLPDGRRVGVKEYGDKKGKPIFQFHGAGSSRYEAAALGGGEHDARLELDQQWSGAAAEHVEPRGTDLQ